MKSFGSRPFEQLGQRKLKDRRVGIWAPVTTSVALVSTSFLLLLVRHLLLLAMHWFLVASCLLLALLVHVPNCCHVSLAC